MPATPESLKKKLFASFIFALGLVAGVYAIHQRWKVSRPFTAYVEDGASAARTYLERHSSSGELLAVGLAGDPERRALAERAPGTLAGYDGRPDALAVVDAAGRASIERTARTLVGLASVGRLDDATRDRALRAIWAAARADGTFAATDPPNESSAPLGEVVAALALAPEAPELVAWLGRAPDATARVAFLYVLSRSPPSRERLASMEALGRALIPAQLAPRAHPLMLGAFEPSGDAVLTALGALGLLSLRARTQDAELAVLLDGAAREAIAYLLRCQVEGAGLVRPRFAPPETPPPPPSDEVAAATAWALVAFRAYLAEPAPRSGP